MRLRLTATFLSFALTATQITTPAHASTQTQTKYSSTDKLQHAVDQIFKNPRQAQRELLSIHSASAKVFLAFVYMSHKVKVPNAGRRVDSLMNAAVAADSNAFSQVDFKPKKYHNLKDMEELLQVLRFITDDEQSVQRMPTAFFVQYPDAAFDAFCSAWGSSRDGYLQVRMTKQESAQSVPEVDKFISTLADMFGDNANGGTIMNMYYRNQTLSLLKASLAPQLFVEKFAQPEDEILLRQLDRFLHTWGNEQLWNQQEVKLLAQQSKAAEQPLANFYKRRLALTQNAAIERARAALRGMTLAWLGEYSPGGVDDEVKSRVYRIFSTNKLSLSDMQKQLGTDVLDVKERGQAQTLAILNYADLDVVEWLAKNGDPLSGGAEPPLFSAVLRPEVVSLLIKCGADVNRTNCIGKTALIQAAQYNALESIKILLLSGAEVNRAMVATDAQEAVDRTATGELNYRVGGRTALMYAAAFSDSATIKYLLAHGAAKNAKDSTGARALKFLDWNKNLSKADKTALLPLLK